MFLSQTPSDFTLLTARQMKKRKSKKIETAIRIHEVDQSFIVVTCGVITWQ